MAWRTASIAAGPGVIGMLGYATHAGDGLPWGWRASRAGGAGDTDYDNFRRYTAAHYHACTLEGAAQEGPRLKDLVTCTQSKAGGPVDVAIIGDSHAEQLFPGVAEALPSLNVAAYVVLTGGHGIDDIYKRVLETPSIRSVVLSMLWRGRLEMPDGSQQYKDVLSLIDALTRAGKTVYVTDDVPMFPFDANTCRRYRWFDWGNCEVGSAADLQRYGSGLAALSQTVIGRSDVRMLGIRKYFCDGAVCSMIKDGRFLYRDSNHINVEASLMVGRKVIEDNQGVFTR